ncbi:metallophosphoesterase family protein [Flexithrix dorotheae]|uniref:metallophosphoesterase family protein n=1 Tax=Flexithrix dorotheae TaxID=70993 RepID=UPI0003637E4D|nr:metallophosphoesterase family protein [Flexithrix dorotheae]
MKKYFAILIFVIISINGCQSPTTETAMEPPVLAPFSGLDTLATNDWWNRGKSKIVDIDVPREEVVAFGMYSVANHVLKLSAQLFPLYPDETREVRLEIKEGNSWKEIQKQTVNDIGWSALFRIENWDDSKNIPYRILHGEKASFEGTIRKDPKDKKEIVLAAMSCNSNQDRGMRENYIRNINFQDPDLVFFAGDQSYDHHEHTAAWLKFGLQFRDIFRNRPCVSIPDDHDVGQPNLWGENGKKSVAKGASDGGYTYHPEYVKMVERCQTAHLPDPYDPTPIEQGIGVYYTNLIIGGVDFAIVEDRKFKSGPMGKIPQQGPRPDHINDPNYDPKTVDVEGLKLLGDRQLNFLEDWGRNKENSLMKVVLSQTGFSCASHLHGSKENRLHADMDSNGWPQTGRNRALEEIKKANAVHIGGDQHLATVIKHGINEFGDGPWSFVVPAIVNNYYSRWWWPANEKEGLNHNPKNPLPWTGDYLDGFANKISMYAYANPDSDSNGAGYGLIRFHKNENKVTFECWPRNVDVRESNASQFVGWPITVEL